MLTCNNYFKAAPVATVCVYRATSPLLRLSPHFKHQILHKTRIGGRFDHWHKTL